MRCQLQPDAHDDAFLTPSSLLQNCLEKPIASTVRV